MSYSCLQIHAATQYAATHSPHYSSIVRECDQYRIFSRIGNLVTCLFSSLRTAMFFKESISISFHRSSTF